MNRLEIIKRVRKNIFDEDSDTFTSETIIDYINEGIDRLKQIIIDLDEMNYLNNDSDIPKFLPSKYHHLIALYSTSRCFSQDERYYQAANYMNEFETKTEELKLKIENGEIIIRDEFDDYGDETTNNEVEYVVDNYFIKRNGVV